MARSTKIEARPFPSLLYFCLSWPRNYKSSVINYFRDTLDFISVGLAERSILLAATLHAEPPLHNSHFERGELFKKLLFSRYVFEALRTFQVQNGPDVAPGGCWHPPVRQCPINFLLLISNLCFLASQSIARAFVTLRQATALIMNRFMPWRNACVMVIWRKIESSGDFGLGALLRG